MLMFIFTHLSLNEATYPSMCWDREGGGREEGREGGRGGREGGREEGRVEGEIMVLPPFLYICPPSLTSPLAGRRAHVKAVTATTVEPPTPLAAPGASTTTAASLPRAKFRGSSNSMTRLRYVRSSSAVGTVRVLVYSMGC